MFPVPQGSIVMSLTVDVVVCSLASMRLMHFLAKVCKTDPHSHLIGVAEAVTKFFHFGFGLVSPGSFGCIVVRTRCFDVRCFKVLGVEATVVEND